MFIESGSYVHSNKFGQAQENVLTFTGEHLFLFVGDEHEQQRGTKRNIFNE